MAAESFPQDVLELQASAGIYTHLDGPHARIPVGRLKIGREWNYKGKRLSYANAACTDGRLQGKGQFKFKDGTLLEGEIIKTCTGK